MHDVCVYVCVCMFVCMYGCKYLSNICIYVYIHERSARLTALGQ